MRVPPPIPPWRTSSTSSLDRLSSTQPCKSIRAPPPISSRAQYAYEPAPIFGSARREHGNPVLSPPGREALVVGHERVEVAGLEEPYRGGEMDGVEPADG